MDNNQQIEEIHKYCYYLRMMTGKKINPETAAKIWIRKYARQWRKLHPHIVKDEKIN